MHLGVRALLAFSAAALAACSGSKDGGTGVAALTVDPQAAALCVGDSLAFTARLLDASGNAVPGAPVRWASSAPQTVAVDSVTGIAHALALGTAQISATVGSLRSASPGRLDVPSDLDPQFVPDTVVLAPGDTFTLGARLRRKSAGPVPNHTPVIAPLDTAPASLTAAGLVTAKAAGTASLSLTACGFTGHGAARVFTPPDSVTGQAYLWVSPPAELHLSLPALLNNFTTTAGQPAFQVFSIVGASNPPAVAFVYEYAATLSATGTFRIDSLLTMEAGAAPCAPPRPFAIFSLGLQTDLLSLSGGKTVVTSFASMGNYAAASGRATLQMRGTVGGVFTQVDTVSAIYTFSAPLVTNSTACH